MFNKIALAFVVPMSISSAAIAESFFSVGLSSNPELTASSGAVSTTAQADRAIILSGGSITESSRTYLSYYAIDTGSDFTTASAFTLSHDVLMGGTIKGFGGLSAGIGSYEENGVLCDFWSCQSYNYSDTNLVYGVQFGAIIETGSALQLEVGYKNYWTNISDTVIGVPVDIDDITMTYVSLNAKY